MVEADADSWGNHPAARPTAIRPVGALLGTGELGGVNRCSWQPLPTRCGVGSATSLASANSARKPLRPNGWMVRPVQRWVVPRPCAPKCGPTYWSVCTVVECQRHASSPSTVGVGDLRLNTWRYEIVPSMSVYVRVFALTPVGRTGSTGRLGRAAAGPTSEDVDHTRAGQTRVEANPPSAVEWLDDCARSGLASAEGPHSRRRPAPAPSSTTCGRSLPEALASSEVNEFTQSRGPTEHPLTPSRLLRWPGGGCSFGLAVRSRQLSLTRIMRSHQSALCAHTALIRNEMPRPPALS